MGVVATISVREMLGGMLGGWVDIVLLGWEMESGLMEARREVVVDLWGGGVYSDAVFISKLFWISSTNSINLKKPSHRPYQSFYLHPARQT